MDAGAPKAAHGEKGAAATPKPKPDMRKKDAQPQAILGKNGKEIRGIVRLVGKDIRGNWTVRRSITMVKGIGMNLGKVMFTIAMDELHADDETMIGELNEEQIGKLEHLLSHPQDFGLPEWMLNRQREFTTGVSRQAIGSDLDYAVKQDIEHDKDIYTWKGYRHAYGQKVRGQRTRTAGRTGMTVGVIRKAVLAKAGAAAAAQTGAAAQAAGAAPAPAKAGEKPSAAAPKAAAGAAPKAAAPAAAKGGSPAAKAEKSAEKK